MLAAHEDQQEDVVQALRLYEARPEIRRLFIVFCAPFVTTGTYFEALFKASWGWDLSIATITIPHIGSTNVGIMLIGGGLTLVLYIAALAGIRMGAVFRRIMGRAHS